VERGTTLLQFLAESGGLTPFAATKRIQLRRTDAAGQERSYLFNYDAVMSGAQTTVITLQKGDVIIVPQRRLFE
jgi:polysaccharide export outer membrane protein